MVKEEKTSVLYINISRSKKKFPMKKHTNRSSKTLLLFLKKKKRKNMKKANIWRHSRKTILKDHFKLHFILFYFIIYFIIMYHCYIIFYGVESLSSYCHFSVFQSCYVFIYFLIEINDCIHSFVCRNFILL